MAAPVARNDELEVRIDSLAYGGNGVGRLDGFVVFVRRALPGDVVRARVTKVKRNHAEAVALEVVEPGAPRVDAPCSHYYEGCGGCRFQDLEYRAQVEAKQAQVGDALARIGRLSGFELEPAVPAESVFRYRNKLEYTFSPGPSQRSGGGVVGEGSPGVTLGFHEAGRWDQVLNVQECWLTTDLGNAIRNAVRDWARAEGLPAYDQEAQQGFLRHLVVREGRNTGQALVLLVTAAGRFDEAPPGSGAGSGGQGVGGGSQRVGWWESFVSTLHAFPQVRSIHWAVNDRPAEVTNLPTTLLWGEEAIEEEILGLRFRVRPNAFLQTNTAMAAALYRLAIEYAGLTGGETVYDLYCGIGTIGLAMARQALTVWGVESSEESVRCALENAELNGVANAAFFAADVADSVGELRARAGPPDVVVVDPPRPGLSGKALRGVAALEAPRLVYVSCNPTTLAGNAKTLSDEHGYRLERARPVDMFPHTPHVETVALFARG